MKRRKYHAYKKVVEKSGVMHGCCSVVFRSWLKRLNRTVNLMYPNNFAHLGVPSKIAFWIDPFDNGIANLIHGL
jgi:hypothetical protein